MALIPCSECGKQVSELAATCPHCGNPINVRNALPERRSAEPSQATPDAQPRLGTERAPVTTQQTARIYKAMQLVGAILFVISLLTCIGGSGHDSTLTGMWLAIIGLSLWVAGRLLAWWKHG